MNKQQFLNKLMGNIFRSGRYRKKYRNSIYGIVIGMGFYALSSFGIEGRDALAYVALGIVGLNALTGYFSVKKLGKLESEIDEQIEELKERRFAGRNL